MFIELTNSNTVYEVLFLKVLNTGNHFKMAGVAILVTEACFIDDARLVWSSIATL